MMFSTYTDNFAKENFIAVSFWTCWTAMSILVISFITYDSYKRALPLIALAVMVVGIIIFAYVGISNLLEILKAPALKVDTDKLQFSYGEQIYEFSNLLPTYNIKKCCGKLRYIFALHFKDGTSLEINLPQQVGLAFAEKYLNKYSKPDNSLYF